MLSRRIIPIVGRSLVAVAAVVTTIGLANCATFAHDESLDGTISSRAFGSRARATLNAIMSGATGTYIGRILADRDSTLERWPDHVGDPLTIWIDSSSTVSGEQAGFPGAVRAAFDDWAATGIPIRFAFVGSARDADIRVRWTEFLDRKTGSTTWRTDRSGFLTRGDITLATHMGDGRELDSHGMKAIALHEVGHALGLAHSLDVHDIMASLVRVDSLSAPDRETIRLLYSLPAGHVR
jgi:Matrixin